MINNRNKGYILLAAVLAIVIAVAATLYPKLSETYSAGINDSVNSGSIASDSTIDTNGEDTAQLQAPDFVVLNGDGEKVSLSDHFGKPIIINFWATWCSQCKSGLPDLNEIYEQYKGDVVFMMVNLTDGRRDNVDGVKQFVGREGYTFPVYFDTKLNASNAYGVYSIPETVFIRSDGTIYDILIGATNQKTLKKYIEAII